MLGGRAGKMALPSNGLILVRKLRENILPCTNEDENLNHRQYVVESCGPDQCWVPSGIALARLQEQAKVVDRWTTLFDGN